MTEEEARSLMKQAMQIDWLNFARVVQTQGEFGLAWRKFDNSYFRPEYNKFLKDMKWLNGNWQDLNEAISVLKVIK